MHTIIVIFDDAVKINKTAVGEADGYRRGAGYRVQLCASLSPKAQNLNGRK